VNYVEYYIETDNETRKRSYVVRITKLRFLMFLLVTTLEKLDPYRFRPFWLFHPITSLHFNTARKVMESENAEVKVTRKWALENFDWDIKKVEQDEKILEQE
jgi:hypothetical protein